MILILGKLKCDDCEAEVDVRLEMKKGPHDIPEFEIEKLPDGWEYDQDYVSCYSSETKLTHKCPNHAPSKTKR